MKATANLNFGEAVCSLIDGLDVTRVGWKNRAYLAPSYTDPGTVCLMQLKASHVAEMSGMTCIDRLVELAGGRELSGNPEFLTEEDLQARDWFLRSM